MVEPLEPQGERRRRQLVEVAAQLIADHGVDAVRVPRVAELAGVGRTALYRYFPGPEDLLAAVQDDFDAKLRERIDDDAFVAGLAGLAKEPDLAAESAATMHLFEAIWDVVQACGPAGLLLRARSPFEEGQSQTSDRFGEVLLALGLTELQATLFADSANAILTRLYFRARRGEIDRAESLRVGHQALAGLLRGLRQDATS